MEEQSEPDQEELPSDAEPGEMQSFVQDDEEVNEGEGPDPLLPLCAEWVVSYTEKSLPLQQLRLPPSHTS